MSVSVREFYETAKEKFDIELATEERGLSRLIIEPPINRPGLALAGFLKHFAFKRIQALVWPKTTTFIQCCSSAKAFCNIVCACSVRGCLKTQAGGPKCWSCKIQCSCLANSLITGNFINAALIMERLMALQKAIQGRWWILWE